MSLFFLRVSLVWLILCLTMPRVAHADLHRYEYTADAMGGTFTIVLYADARPLGDRAATAAFTELRRLERMLSHYRADSEWSAVNRHAAERAVPVPQELFELLAASIDYSRRSEGAFDITVGPLVRAWDFKDGTGRLASSPRERAPRRCSRAARTGRSSRRRR